MTGLALAHALAVGLHYHVGSFDDDASYVITGKALAHGAGFGTRLGTGLPLVATYPPGFAAFLVPVALFAGSSTEPYRVVPLLFYLAIFPLTWSFLGRRKVSVPCRAAILGLLALNPVLGTYGTMVMAETLFVVVMLGLVAAGERWAGQSRALTWTGVTTVVLAGLLIWVKEAGLGLVAGVAVFLLLGRSWRKAVLLGAGSVLLFSPVLIARLVLGVPLVGSRYENDLNGHSGLVHRLIAVPHSVQLYLSMALPKSLVPTNGGSFPNHGGASICLNVIRWTVGPLIVIGVASWIRHRGWALPVIVGGYGLEALAYPYINERRVVLVLPVIVAWYVLGAVASARLIGAGLSAVSRSFTGRQRRGKRLVAAMSRTSAGQRLAAGVGVAALAVPLVVQFPKDYLLPLWVQSPKPLGSPYMALIQRLGPPSRVVETDFIWTTSLATGHRTARNAYNVKCPPLTSTARALPPEPTPVAGALGAALLADRASFLLIASLEAPGLLTNPCVVRYAAAQPSAVRLLRIPINDAAVYELLGAGTAQPTLRDYAAGAKLVISSPQLTWRQEATQVRAAQPVLFPVVAAANGEGSIGWSWSGAAPISQISLGAAEDEDGRTSGVQLQLRSPAGRWITVASAHGAVGGHSPVPYLLAQPEPPIRATAVRVVVDGQGEVGVHDLHAIGSIP